jgi:hypothetical protein
LFESPEEVLTSILLEGKTMKSLRVFFAGALLIVAYVAVAHAAAKTVTVKGYVLDSACAFTKGLTKPISADCARACAKAGSPLVILAADGTIYWPIADTTPSSGQNEKLMPFAGQKVTATGKVFQRGGSNALVVETIEALKTDSK